MNKIFEADYGLSIVQWSLLNALIEMPTVSPQTLAKTLGISPSTLTQAMVRLEKRDLIFVCDDPKDARKKIVSITRLGKDKLDEAYPSFEKSFGQLYQISTELDVLNDFLLRGKQQVKQSDKTGRIGTQDLKRNRVHL